MNYLNIYNNLIEKRRKDILFKSENLYIEKHHIIPKCMDGKDIKDNLVYLTPREHYIAHLLLYKIYCNTKYRKPLYNAYTVMCYCNNEHENRNIKFNSKLYEKVRINYINSEQFKIAKEESSKRARERWDNLSDEEKEKRKNRLRKICNTFQGRKHSAKTIEIIRRKAIERTRNKEWKNPFYGEIWIHNIKTGEIKHISKDEKIPDGWSLGKKTKIIKCPDHHTRQFMWINNGKIDKYIKKDSFEKYNKLGWIKGRTTPNRFCNHGDE